MLGDNQNIICITLDLPSSGCTERVIACRSRLGGRNLGGFAMRGCMITQSVTYWLAIVVVSAILVWGLRLVSRELQKPDPTGRTLLARALSEKKNDCNSGTDPSFSRVAGALGAIGLASTFVGIGYWVIYQLFLGDNLAKLNDLGIYFLAGSALFLPYAFNQISSIFKSS
jgi:hypothetical protein